MIIDRCRCLRLRHVVFVAAFASIFATPAVAQPTVDVEIKSVTANQIQIKDKRTRGWAIFVVFTKNFKPDSPADAMPATNTSNYRIINVSNGSFVPVSEARFVVIPHATVSKVRLTIPSAEALNATDIFHLYALNLLFDGSRPNAPLQHPVELAKQPDPDLASSAGPNPEPKPAWALSSSKDRDDSDIYGSYEVIKSRGSATTGTADVKVAIPFYKNFWSRTSRFSPLVDIKASSDATADPDSLKFALEWFLPLYVGDNPNSKFPWTAIDWVNSGVIEAPKNFDNVNALWQSKWLLPSAQIPSNGKRYRLFLDIFGGHELGKNLKSPLKPIEGEGVFRLMVGANLAIQVPVKNLTLLKGFDFNTSYTRRVLLKRELSFDKDSDGNLVLVDFGKGPRDHVDSKFVMKINDFFGPYVGFEWGRVPPNYELADHKWTFGLLFKAKMRIK